MPMTTAAADAPHSPVTRPLPPIIQGGMGVGVSSWKLAREVSRAGQLGVVSGTALDVVVARRLQDGDADGHVRRALGAFPVPALAERVLRRYFRAEGRGPNQPYLPVPKLRVNPPAAALELSVVANFVEVWLAKEGHSGQVGINFLEKVQMATPSAAYGAMLAGVDAVLMGAGIPTEIPQLLDRLARHEPARLDLHVDAATTSYSVRLDPQEVTRTHLGPLRRPFFVAIISAHVLAAFLARDPATRPDGFVVEGLPAGGHNAPPRGRLTLDDDGQPIYAARDVADVAKVAAVGLPFWLAGGYSTPERVEEARAAGARGVQVGTLFALARESGIEPSLRRDLVRRLAAGEVSVRTDPLASPTGFPFKVVSLPGTLSDPTTYEERPRVCDLGYLRIPYEREPGKIGYRCPAEPVADFVRKGGSVADSTGRLCLCNGLTATIGLGQTHRDGYHEPALVTLGTDLAGSEELLARHPDGWSADQAVAYLLGAAPATDAPAR